MEQDIALEVEITEIGAHLDDWQGGGTEVLSEPGRPLEALIAVMTAGNEESFFGR